MESEELVEKFLKLTDEERAKFFKNIFKAFHGLAEFLEATANIRLILEPKGLEISNDFLKIFTHPSLPEKLKLLDSEVLAEFLTAAMNILRISQELPKLDLVKSPPEKLLELSKALDSIARFFDKLAEITEKDVGGGDS